MRFSTTALFGGVAAALTGSTLWAQTNPIDQGSITVKLELAAHIGGNGGAIDFAIPGDGSNRMFIAGQSGFVRLVKNGSLVATPFLNLSAAGITLETNGEKGLLGMAFHPNFAAPADVPGSGKFYTYTSEPRDGIPNFNHPELGTTLGDHFSVFREWTVSTANPDIINTAIESRILFTVNQPQSNHNGGAIRFGPDKYLYIALGDGGGGNDAGEGPSDQDGHTDGKGNGQDTSVVYGKILRIDPTAASPANGRYGIPSDNPFVGQDGVDEIYAFGLRNPFRIGFSRANGKLYAGDVGQTQREEVDIIENGKNYGWVYMEGTRVNRAGGVGPFAPPIAEYTHGDGVSIIGGYAYDGAILPQFLGKYVFGDLNGNENKARLFHVNENGGTVQEFKYNGGVAINSQLYSFGEDAFGELYALFGNGDVLRIAPEISPAWNVNGGGGWGTAANWTGGLPNAPGATARFLSGLSAAQSPAVIPLDGVRTVGTMIFDNDNTYSITPGAGGSLTLNNAGRPAGIYVTRGTHNISAPITTVGDSFINIGPAGTLILSGQVTIAPDTNLTKRYAGLLDASAGITGSADSGFIIEGGPVSASHVRDVALTIRNGAVLTISPNGGEAGTSVVNAMNFEGAPDAWQGTLDLKDNDLIVQTTPDTRDQVLASITNQIKTARNDPAGLWSGNGITTTDPAAFASPGKAGAAAASAGLAGLVVRLNDHGNGTPLYTTFDGQPVNENSILVKYSWNGDTDLNGVIDADDYFRIDTGYSAGGTGYYNGDFDYSGVVDADDYFLIDSAFAGQTGILGVGASVPEPGAITGLFIASLAISGRRRRSRNHSSR